MSSNVTRFVGGANVSRPWLLLADDAIVNLTGGTVTIEVWWLGTLQITLTVGSGISLINPAPAVAAPGDEQAPHGLFLLTTVQTALIPLPSDDVLASVIDAFWRIKFVSSEGVTMKSERFGLERIL